MTEQPRAMPPASQKDLRSFGVIFGVVATLIALFQFWKERTTGGLVFGGIALAIFAVAAVFPGWLRPAHGPWMKFAEILGHINTRILLGLFYFVGVTPTGLLMRLAGKDPMTRTFKGQQTTSYWSKPTVHPDGTRHFDRQF